MIRRDYFIRTIEALGQELQRIESLKDQERWDEAGVAVDAEVKRLTGKEAAEVVKFSEIELLALLMDGEGTQAVRDKAWMLTLLLKQAGDLALAQDRGDEADAFYFKGLHLLLKVLHGADAHEFPEFVPQVELLVNSISAELPVETEALLMEHYETTGQFGKAEDALDAILKAQPDNEDDERLALGNLPRAEVEAGLAALRTRAG
jgi:hypothetical protein